LQTRETLRVTSVPTRLLNNPVQQVPPVTSECPQLAKDATANETTEADKADPQQG
jgi:hypothetical protein